MLKDQWSNMVWPASEEAISDPDTGVERETLKLIGRASVKVPDEFVRRSDYFLLGTIFYDSFLLQEIHPRLQRHVKHRLETIDSDKGLDWATAEVNYSVSD